MGKTFSVSVLKAIFNRRGSNGKYTMPFDNLSSSQQNIVLGVMEFRNLEKPVIASVKNYDYWFLITNERLIISDRETITDLEHSVIKDASPNLMLNRNIGAQSKKEFSLLTIFLHTKQTIELEVESGPPFSGIWNVLKSIAGKDG